ncbi:MAG: hypothetical protein CMD65_05265, partial [Gammaproteobacteria bacterium]|nr:hypothetical protein [Gammaproteobacteria bacterium]
FIQQIKKELPQGNIIEAKSGVDCFTWFVPKSWDVKHAILKNELGETIIDFKNNPLHLIQYSSAYKGELNFEELKSHLFYSKERPKDIPFIYRKQYQFELDDSWGFSMPYETFEKLNTNLKYFVDIDVTFSDKHMTLFDFHLPGKKPDTIFFAAHSCHPGQVNDGIAGIALLIELFKWLQKKEEHNYSYRMIIGPEYFAAAYYLTLNEKIKHLKYGFFLDMMVHSGPIGFSHSYENNTLVDKVTEFCLEKNFESYGKFDYRRLYGNDEMFYDGPDFQIPTVSLGRSNFENYHHSSDDMESINKKNVDESRSLLKNIIKIFENDRVLKRKYVGPLYLTRFDLYIDPKKDREGYKNLQNIQIEMDGKKSTLDIAQKLNIDIGFVNNFADSLLEKNLAEIV